MQLEIHLKLSRRWKLRIVGQQRKRQQEKNPRDRQCGFHGVAPFFCKTREWTQYTRIGCQDEGFSGKES
jgi:hypothetical protein